MLLPVAGDAGAGHDMMMPAARLRRLPCLPSAAREGRWRHDFRILRPSLAFLPEVMPHCRALPTMPPYDVAFTITFDFLLMTCTCQSAPGTARLLTACARYWGRVQHAVGIQQSTPIFRRRHSTPLYAIEARMPRPKG